ncbi:endonuclease III-like protein 1 [Branchiostoma floridae x Branchiostoma japonicum]
MSTSAYFRPVTRSQAVQSGSKFADLKARAQALQTTRSRGGKSTPTAQGGPSSSVDPTGPPQKKTAQKRVKREHTKIEYEAEADGDAKGSSRSAKPRTTHSIKKERWEPERWREQLENIKRMRAARDAPVDSMGCQTCPDKDAPPEVKRYHALISLMLSSQTKDQMTSAAMKRLIDHGLTVDNILKTSDQKLGELIYPVGFWKTKVKYIKNTTQILKDQYGGDIPATVAEMVKLPGVGPKMAYLTMDVGWGKVEGICVDTHVHRISNRLGWLKKPTKVPEDTRVALEEWLPREHWSELNWLLVGFGQQTCLPVSPKCSGCLNKEICPFGKSQLRYSKNKKSPKK